MSEAAELQGPDAFLGGRLQLRQPQDGHRAGLDAVMLAAAAPAGPSDRVLDVGCGSGVVGLCIAARVASCRVTGLDVAPDLVALATGNAARNGLEDRYRAVCHSLTSSHDSLEALGLRRESFEVVVANPPYYAAGRASASDLPARRRASLMPEGGLDTWARFMTGQAVPGGILVLVHRADALGDLLAALDGRCGGTTVFPLFPRAGQPAGRVLVAARKGSRAPLRLLPGLVLHGTGNGFTPEADAVLRHGAALDLGN